MLQGVGTRRRRYLNIVRHQRQSAGGQVRIHRGHRGGLRQEVQIQMRRKEEKNIFRKKNHETLAEEVLGLPHSKFPKLTKTSCDNHRVFLMTSNELSLNLNTLTPSSQNTTNRTDCKQSYVQRLLLTDRNVSTLRDEDTQYNAMQYDGL